MVYLIVFIFLAIVVGLVCWRNKTVRDSLQEVNYRDYLIKSLQETIKELKDERDRLARQVQEVRIVAGGTEEDLPLTHSNAAINIVDLYENLENDEGLEIQFHSLGITVIGFHGEFERRISLSNELINHANFNILDSAIEQLLAELRGEK